MPKLLTINLPSNRQTELIENPILQPEETQPVPKFVPQSVPQQEVGAQTPPPVPLPEATPPPQVIEKIVVIEKQNESKPKVKPPPIHHAHNSAINPYFTRHLTDKMAQNMREHNKEIREHMGDEAYRALMERKKRAGHSHTYEVTHNLA